MQIYHQLKPDGFLEGVFSGIEQPNGTVVDDEGRTRSNYTLIDFRPIPPRRARFVNGAWIDDGTQETDDEAQRATHRNALLAAKQALKNFDRNTATAQQTRDAVAALIVLFRELIDSP